jgi:hypothetical protein
VEALNEHKRATSPPTASMMSRIFAILFPGSPAVNAILATVYISGPPSMRLLSNHIIVVPPSNSYRLPPGTMSSKHRSLISLRHGRFRRRRTFR